MGERLTGVTAAIESRHEHSLERALDRLRNFETLSGHEALVLLGAFALESDG